MGEDLAVRFVETQNVKRGVKCDVYEFIDDKTKDLGIIHIQKGEKSPRQKVIHGKRTVEGHISGKSELTVVRASGTVDKFELPNERGIGYVDVNIGDIMQWEAIDDLVFYEVCEPAYSEGRFQDLD